VAALAAFGLIVAACAKEETPGGGGTTTGPAFESELTQSGVLKVGSCLDYPPFESVKGGKETGFDVELVEAIASKLGLQVDWVRANFDTIFTAVSGQNHPFDMVAAAVTATGDTGTERAQVVDFSSFYYNSRQSLAVNVDKTPDLTSTDQLGEGDTVGVQKGTTGKIWAEDNLASKGVQIKTYTAAPDAFRDLQAGTIAGVINDEPSSAEIVKEFPGTAVVQPIDTNEKYAFAFAKYTPNLVSAVNEALQEVIDDGTYATIFGKYFPGVEVPAEFQPTS
jgi:ABC-type amino acid transport substrate-binding protein